MPLQDKVRQRHVRGEKWTRWFGFEASSRTIC